MNDGEEIEEYKELDVSEIKKSGAVPGNIGASISG